MNRFRVGKQMTGQISGSSSPVILPLPATKFHVSQTHRQSTYKRQFQRPATVVRNPRLLTI